MPPQPKPPRYPKPITVEKLIASPAVDANGQIDYSNPANWENQFAGNCRILTRGSREFRRASRDDASIDYALALRWCAATVGIKPQSMRIKFLGRTFDISGRENSDEANREVLLSCTELVGG